jgi:hypothetical protein
LGAPQANFFLKPQQASGAPAVYQANEAYEACEASQSIQAEIFLHGKKQLSLERASMLQGAAG